MDDLLQIQIQESCKLALPEGLKELMYDISREVLRAQPNDLYEFIANYLSALLVTRENLRVANQVCSNVCENMQYTGLEHDLRDLGLCEEDIVAVKDVLAIYFQQELVSETNLLRELIKKTSITDSQLEGVQEAVQAAFKRDLVHNTTLFESSTDTDISESTRAARFTTKLYRKSKPSPEEYEKAAGTIQSAYRAYGVRRHRNSKSVRDSLPDDIAQGRPTKALRFGSDDDLCSRSNSVTRSDRSGSLADWSNMTEKTEDIFVSASVNKQCTLTVASSTSLAGSYVQLGHKPYSAHEDVQEESEPEYFEQERTNVDYTLHVSKESNDQNIDTTGDKDIPEEIVAEEKDNASIVEEIECCEYNEMDLCEIEEMDIKVVHYTNNDNNVNEGFSAEIHNKISPSLETNKVVMEKNSKVQLIDNKTDVSEEVRVIEKIGSNDDNIIDKNNSQVGFVDQVQEINENDDYLLDDIIEEDEDDLLLINENHETNNLFDNSTTKQNAEFDPSTKASVLSVGQVIEKYQQVTDNDHSNEQDLNETYQAVAEKGSPNKEVDKNNIHSKHGDKEHHVAIDSKPSQIYFDAQSDKSSGGSHRFEHNTGVPKTPFHSLTDFGVEEEETDIPYEINRISDDDNLASFPVKQRESLTQVRKASSSSKV